MRLSFEVWLVIGIYGFYLFDSIRLLQNNQLIIYKGCRGWKIICPDSNWQIFRKIPYISNPLLPNIPIFIDTWSMAKGANNTDATPIINKFIDSIYPITYFVSILWVLMCICMPLALFFYGAGLVLLIITISTYAIIFTMLAILYTKKSELGLSFRNYVSVVFDCIACPPFAINLVRKVAWQYKINVNPFEFAIMKLSKSDLSKLAKALISKVDERLLYEDSGDTRSEKLKAYRCRLSEFYNECN